MMQARARNLRKNMTDAENRMWYYLKNRRLGRYKFVREQVISKYIADFVCREKKLIIEVDGGKHMTAVAYATTYKGFRSYWLSSSTSLE